MPYTCQLRRPLYRSIWIDTVVASADCNTCMCYMHVLPLKSYGPPSRAIMHVHSCHMLHHAHADAWREQACCMTGSMSSPHMITHIWRSRCSGRWPTGHWDASYNAQVVE